MSFKTVQVTLDTWKKIMALSLSLENGRRLTMDEVIKHLLKFYEEHQREDG